MTVFDGPGRRGGRLIPFIKFNLVGAGNTLLDLLVFALLSRLGIHVLIAQGVAYGCGMINSYLLNTLWTFRKEGGPALGRMARFGALNVAVLAVSLAMLHLLVREWHLPGPTAKLTVTAVTVALNFAGCRYFVFTSRA